MKLDSKIRQLPADRAVVVLGWENRFFKMMPPFLSGYDVTLSRPSVRIGMAGIPAPDHSFVLTARHPKDPDLAVLFVAADPPEALAGLGQKLPHYHKYSYLAFEGQEPANVAKGNWPVTDSPLTVFIPSPTGEIRKVERGRLAQRKPLATLDPVFSKERMMKTVRFLASPELGGRGFGSEGLDRAADHIAHSFEAAGLLPGGDAEGSWFQTWEDKGGDPAATALMKNVIGVLPGRKPGLKDQSVVIAAHYDHLGLGWPESRDHAQGKVHPGADDNASGVAVLIELARVLAKGPQPERTIVFIALTGEEAGKRGSKYYVANEKHYPAGRCIGMVNLDTVGRLGKNKLLVLGAGSAKEWVHIFRGVGFVTNVEIETSSVELDSSDQTSFQEAGVPAVQLFSGPNLDYHRTTDTTDKIDADGLVKVAAVAKETIEYLAAREQPLSASGRPQEGKPLAAGAERKVIFGAVPDFAFNGKGLRLSGVVPGSPAEAAGLREGDVIVRVGSAPVESLKDFSDILKTLKPGDKTSVTYSRDGAEVRVDTILKER